MMEKKGTDQPNTPDSPRPVTGEHPAGARQPLPPRDIHQQEFVSRIDEAMRDLRRGLRQDSLQKLEGVTGEVDRARQQFGAALGSRALVLVEVAAQVAIGRVRKALGQTDLATNAFDAAKRLFERLTDPERAEPRGYRDYGMALYELGRSEEARAALLTAEERGDLSFETSLYRGLLALDSGDFGGAAPLLRTAVEKEPADPVAVVKLATALDEGGNPEATTEAAEVYRRGGRVLIDTGRSEEALAVFRRAEELVPEPEGRLLVAESLRMLSRYEEAIKVVEGDNDYVFALGTRGAALVSLARYEEALAVLDRALGMDPDYAFGLGYRGEALRLLGRAEEALGPLERAVALEPDAASWVAIYAEVLRALGRTEEALVSVDRALELDPRWAFTHGTRGAALSALNRFDEALAAFDRAIELDPQYIFAYANRGDVLRKMDRLPEALEGLEVALRLNPDYSMAHAWRGDVLRRLNRLPEALEALDRAVALDPDLALAQGRRGEVLRRLARLPEAEEALRRAVELDPDDATTQASRGEVLRLLDRPQDALEAFDRAVDLNPGDAFAQCRRAEALLSLGRLDEAFEAAGKALGPDTKPSDLALGLDPGELEAKALALQGDVLRSQERWEEALELLDKSLQRLPDYAFAHGTRGEALRMLDRMDEAKAALDRAVELDPSYAWAIASRGELLRELGKYADARKDIAKALELVGGQYGWALTIQGWIELGTGHYDAALQAFEAAIALDEDQQYAHVGRGWSLRLLQRSEEAIEVLTKAVERYPDFPYAVLNLADSLILAGRGDEAREGLEKLAKELEGQTKPNADALSNLAWAQTLLGRFREAMRTLIDANTLEPEEAEHLFGLGLAAMGARRYDLGLEEYRRAVGQARKREEPERRRGLALAARYDLDGAVQVHSLERTEPLLEALTLLQGESSVETEATAPAAAPVVT